eukprot:gene13054-14397_t
MDCKSQQSKTKQDTLRASIEALRSDFVQFKQSFNPGCKKRSTRSGNRGQLRRWDNSAAAPGSGPGNKCVIQCNLDGFSTEALWDIGSQVSVLSKQYLDDNFPNLQVAPLRQLLECDIELDVRAANGTPVPYIGYVELKLNLANNLVECGCKVPFLVTNSMLANPIVGFNVIKEIIKKGCLTDENTFLKVLINSFKTVHLETIEAFVDFMQNERQTDVRIVKSPKNPIRIQPKQIIKLTCRSDSETSLRETPVLFTPEEQNLLPSGLEVNESLLNIPRGNV